MLGYCSIEKWLFLRNFAVIDYYIKMYHYTFITPIIMVLTIQIEPMECGDLKVSSNSLRKEVNKFLELIV